MLALWNRLHSAVNETQHGATMVEYALLVALIAILSLLVISVLGEETSTIFSTAADGFG